MSSAGTGAISAAQLLSTSGPSTAARTAAPTRL